MTTYRVPRRQINARVLLEGGQEIEGQLFASMEDQFGEPGLLIDRLNDVTEPFLPVVTDKGAVLVSSQRILMVRVDSEDDSAVFEAAGESIDARIHLIDRIAVSGKIQIDLPPEDRRLLDFLNQLPRFFPLVVPTGICLINSRYVVSAREGS